MRGPSRQLTPPDARRWSPVLFVLVVSLGIRGLQLWWLNIASASQLATGNRLTAGQPFEYYAYKPSPASPGLGPVLGNWDAQYYMRIAEAGYPRADQVQSATDAWTSAFPPGFPVVTRAMMVLTGLPFVWAALVVNTLLTLCAALLLYRLLRDSGLGTRVAVTAAIGVSLLPASPVLVTAYSEALALALVVLALRLLMTHRYLLLSVVVLLLGVTRPVALALAPVVLVHAALRWRAERQSVGGWEWGGMVLAVAAAAVSPWVWPRSAAYLYGVPESNAYAGSERTNQIVSGLGEGYLPNALNGSGVRGVVLVLAGVLLVVGVPTLLGLRIGWPAELLAWGAAYVAMVVIVTPPSGAVLRYLVLAAPMLVVVFAAPVVHPSRARYVVLFALAGLCLWTQWLWIQDLYIFDIGSEFAP